MHTITTKEVDLQFKQFAELCVKTGLIKNENELTLFEHNECRYEIMSNSSHTAFLTERLIQHKSNIYDVLYNLNQLLSLVVIRIEKLKQFNLDLQTKIHSDYKNEHE